MVRALHASPDAPAVDVYVDDEVVESLTNVPFGTMSQYLEIPSGDHNVKVYATGSTTDPVINANVTVAAGARYTIAATGALASISAQVLEDDAAPDCEAASVRVVHFSADAPAVDVAPAGAPAADAVVKNLTYPNATDYIALPAGSYDLDVRLAGTTTVALSLPDVSVEACNAYSVFAIGSAATPAVGDNALQVAVVLDATTGAEPTMTVPPTDTVAPGAAMTQDGSGMRTALLALAGIIGFAVVGRRLATRPVRSDEV
jgi:hypothetical protein